MMNLSTYWVPFNRQFAICLFNGGFICRTIQSGHLVVVVEVAHVLVVVVLVALCLSSLKKA